MEQLTMKCLTTHKPSFCHTSVEYFGPIDISLSRNRTDKRYGALFTCLNTRAVYLDLAMYLYTKDFLNTMRRFIRFYGRPETINSDNGTNFVGAEKELLRQIKIMEQTKEIIEWSSKRSMTWKFQPPSAPHFVGNHESMVKSNKQALYRALELKKRRLRLPNEDMLRTILFEVAGLLNSRPLTYVSSNPKYLRPLTPNDLLNRPVDLWIKQYLPSLIGRS